MHLCSSIECPLAIMPTSSDNYNAAIDTSLMKVLAEKEIQAEVITKKCQATSVVRKLEWSRGRKMMSG